MSFHSIHKVKQFLVSSCFFSPIMASAVVNSVKTPLLGKLALVTGGGSGIGKAVCQAFAREGAKVVVADLNVGAAQKTAADLSGESHSCFEVDVGNSNSVNGLMKEVLEKYNEPPSIAVNCAGITRDKLLLRMDENVFDEVIRVNLKGTYLLNHAVGDAMVKHGIKNGSIVNISSIVAKCGNIGQVNYAAAKSGVIGLTKTVAKELAKFGVRCNVVLPGFIQTPMVSTVPEKVLESIKTTIPLGRLGEPEEVADLCVFLASEKSSYITGSVIEITGGLSM
ncbi:hypothetical protein CHUAL_010002 [Chamberlinius hualienensis]